MGLYVGVLCAEQLAGLLPGDVFDYIHIGAPAVISLVRISFRIFICKMAAHCGHYRRGYEVFREIGRAHV